MKNLYSIIAVMLIFFPIINSCSTVLKASYNYDNNVDFKNYTTFAFYEDEIDKLKINDLDRKRFITCIKNELEKKGILLTYKQPDLLVSLFIERDVKTQKRYLPYIWFFWRPFIGLNVQKNMLSNIVIDLIDNADKKLVWRGQCLGKLNVNEKAKNAQIFKIVSKILNQYPI